jgi:hypothetical protein
VTLPGPWGYPFTGQGGPGRRPTERNRTERDAVSTAVRPRTPPFEQVAVLRTNWSGRYEDSLAWDPVHLIPDRDASSVLGPERRVTSVSAGHGVVVGLPGLEPGTSSLSGIEGSALCGPAFSQVAGERQRRRDAFLEPCPDQRTDAMPWPRQSMPSTGRRQGDGAPGGRGSPIERRDRGQAACLYKQRS